MDFIEAWNNFISKFNDVGFITSFVLSVLVLTAVYYFIFHTLIKNKASSLIGLIIFAVIIVGLSFMLNKNLDGVFFLLLPIAMILIVFILFSVEIKRSIWRKNSFSRLDTKHSTYIMLDEEIVKKCIDHIIVALQDMAKNDVGALIVLSNGNIPNQILDSGVKLKSDISSELIESVFFPKTPLHDGAMIINGTQIVAAGCFLPLSQNIDNIQKDLGTRHRAGLGITENIDVTSLIVSEETGIISIAKGGNLTRFADAALLKKTLTDYFWQDIEGGRK